MIRIGYDPDRLPFSYINTAGDTGGISTSTWRSGLPRSWKPPLSSCPSRSTRCRKQLNDDHFDIAMSGVYGTAEQSAIIRFSDPYMFATMALVVPDHRDVDFATMANIRRLEKIRIGIHRSLSGSYSAVLNRLRERYPECRIRGPGFLPRFLRTERHRERLGCLATPVPRAAPPGHYFTRVSRSLLPGRAKFPYLWSTPSAGVTTAPWMSSSTIGLCSNSTMEQSTKHTSIGFWEGVASRSHLDGVSSATCSGG